MSDSLTNIGVPGAPAVPGAFTPADPFEGVEFLTKYEDAPPPRPDFIACISAGYKGKDGNPVISRDGTIYISDPQGRAIGLAEALAATGGKSLTITLPSDRMVDIFFQHYRKEGRTRLEAHGDAKGITTIAADGARKFHPAGTPEFEQLRRECKVTYEIAFYLARWVTGRGQYPRPEIYWPDGVGAYRIRTTSEKTVNNFRGCVRELAARTGGPVAGFPIEVRLAYPQVADKTGTKRSVPLFTFILKPPGGFAMDAGAFRHIAQASAAILPSMHLVALPAPQTVDDAIADYEAELLTIPVDAETACKRYFAIAAGTEYATKEGRAAFISELTHGRTSSLKEYLATATPEEIACLLDSLESRLAVQQISAGDEEVIEPEIIDEPPVSGDLMATEKQLEAIEEEWRRVFGDTSKAAIQRKIWKHLRENTGKDKRADLTQAEAASYLAALDGMTSVPPAPASEATPE